MTEEVISSPVAPVSEAAPVITETAAPIDAPIVTETVVTEAPVIETAPATVLGAEPPKADAPVETTVELVETPQAEASQSDEPAPLPTYDAFELPEEFTVDNERFGEFTKALGEFEALTKVDHGEVQKLGQKLIERHIAEVQTIADTLNKKYLSDFEKQTKGWLDSFKADPEIGGNRWETTANAAVEFITTHGGNQAQQAEFRQLMESTGVGNHPAMIRMLANAMNANREGRPLPAAKPMTETSKVAKRYGTV